MANVDNPDICIDDTTVALFDSVVKPDIFNDDNNVVSLFNVVKPDTFNDDNNVILLFNVVKPLTFNDDNNVALLFNVVNPETFKLVVCNDENAVYPFIYPNILVVVLFNVFIDNVDALDKIKVGWRV